MKKPYYYQLNLIRIVAAAIIAFFFHYMIIFGYAPGLTIEKNLDALCFLIYMAAEAFFTISGFVMYYNYTTKIEEEKLGFRGFLWGRVKRIYPTMILSVCVMAAAQWFGKAMFGQYCILNSDDGRNTIKAFLLSVAGVNSGWICNHDQYSINGVTWFISILMICYVLFYGILRLAKQRWKQNVCFVIVQLIGILVLWHPLNLPLLYESCGRGYLDFFCGVLLAQIVEQLQEKKAKIIGILGIVLFAIYVIVFCIGKVTLWDTAGSVVLNSGILMILLGYPLFEKIAKNRFISYAGNISFDIYLWNLPTFAIAVLIVRGVNLPYIINTFVGWILVALFNIVIAIVGKEIVEIVQKTVHERITDNK